MSRNSTERAHLYMYVRKKLKPHAGKVFAALMPGGCIQTGLYICGGLAGGKGHGCVTDLDSCIGYDLATQTCWGDFIDLGRHLWGCMAEESALRIMEILSVDIEDFERELRSKKRYALSREIPEKERVYPPPPVTPPPPTWHGSLGEVREAWAYTDIHGNTLFYVAYFRNHYGKTERRSFSLYRKINGRLQWFPGYPPSPHPLYNLPRIHGAEPDAIILIVRGEANVHLAERLFPGIVGTTWPPYLQRLDVLPLRGRNVLIWPEAGVYGCAAALRIIQKLLNIGAVPVILDTSGFTLGGWSFGGPLPNGLSYQELFRQLIRCTAEQFAASSFIHYPDLHSKIKELGFARRESV